MLTLVQFFTQLIGGNIPQISDKLQTFNLRLLYKYFNQQYSVELVSDKVVVWMTFNQIMKPAQNLKILAVQLIFWSTSSWSKLFPSEYFHKLLNKPTRICEMQSLKWDVAGQIFEINCEGLVNHLFHIRIILLQFFHAFRF